MTRLWVALAFVVALALPLLSMPASASAANCGFALGFKTLHDLIPTTVGTCLVNEHHDNSIGDSLQETSGPTGAGGLLVWRKADNWTAFTDGNRTWINGPFGLEDRFNVQLFLWETGYAKDNEVPESQHESDVCSSLPGTATGQPGAACFTIYAKKKILTLGDTVSQPAPLPPVEVVPRVPAPVVVMTPATITISDLDGLAILVAHDGHYLGVISSNQYDGKSICDGYGPYGSSYSSDSIRDQYG